MTRKEMIEALTLFELQFLFGSPEYLEDVASFFADGGFGKSTDEELLDACIHKAILPDPEEEQ